MLTSPVSKSEVADLWRDEAACRTADPDIFFAFSSYAKALKVCKACPVTEECREYAVRENLDYGVWGGKIFDRQKPKWLLPEPVAEGDWFCYWCARVVPLSETIASGRNRRLCRECFQCRARVRYRARREGWRSGEASKWARDLAARHAWDESRVTPEAFRETMRAVSVLREAKFRRAGRKRRRPVPKPAPKPVTATEFTCRYCARTLPVLRGHRRSGSNRLLCVDCYRCLERASTRGTPEERTLARQLCAEHRWLENKKTGNGKWKPD